MRGRPYRCPRASDPGRVLDLLRQHSRSHYPLLGGLRHGRAFSSSHATRPPSSASTRGCRRSGSQPSRPGRARVSPVFTSQEAQHRVALARADIRPPRPKTTPPEAVVCVVTLLRITSAYRVSQRTGERSSTAAPVEDTAPAQAVEEGVELRRVQRLSRSDAWS